MAGSAAKSLQEALLGVLRSPEPGAQPWRPRLVAALTALGNGPAAEAAVSRLERQAAKGQR